MPTILIISCHVLKQKFQTFAGSSLLNVWICGSSLSFPTANEESFGFWFRKNEFEAILWALGKFKVIFSELMTKRLIKKVPATAHVEQKLLVIHLSPDEFL